jgi:hypothetical protein
VEGFLAGGGCCSYQGSALPAEREVLGMNALPEVVPAGGGCCSHQGAALPEMGMQVVNDAPPDVAGGRILLHPSYSHPYCLSTSKKECPGLLSQH